MARKPTGRRPGRPTREEAEARALAGLDVTKVDPKKILRQIAANRAAAPSARVAACRELLRLADDRPAKPKDEPLAARTNERALRLLRGGKDDN